ncbi:MAG: DUF1015 domain-containing protein [Clostridia bacterium]|nr:DUF1015 domain-containing protein [Clostridia bacterium]
MKQSVFLPTDILLPRLRDEESMRRWSVVACDQYTSEPEYWEGVERIVGEAPSTLRITYPELYLNAPDKAARIEKIGKIMQVYASETLCVVPETMIYIERTMKNGTVRHGIVGAFDLEEYSYEKGSQSAIRATEGTVLSRIPPRVQIRKDAILETPHVMVLIDDKENRVMSAAEVCKEKGAPCYDFDLMQDGGRLRGWVMTAEEICSVDEAIAALSCPTRFFETYHTDKAPLVFAVGDGNHSLATAKACYEALKAEIGAEAAKAHPARYALAELVNLHDDALEFEPIYRVVFGVNADDVLKEMQNTYPSMLITETADHTNEIPTVADAHVFRMMAGDKEWILSVADPKTQLPVGTLQSFLDDYLASHPDAEVDYIHGMQSTRTLAKKEYAVGFLFEGMKKDALYRTVIFDGALPRKTFSMGEADEKRYYLECRRIRP